MKKLFCAALILATASVLASCGGGGKKDAGGFRPALDTKTACDLKVIGSYDNFEALGAEAERFKEYYPNVRVLYTKLDGSYNDNIISFLEGSEKPNIFFSYTWMMGNEKYSSVVGHMEDLSDPALKMDLNCIRPNLLSKDDQSKSYMVPVFSRTYGMLVNEDLFKKENIQIPTTWTGLLETCSAFKEKEYGSPIMGYTKYDYDKKKDIYKASNGLMHSLAYPLFVTALADNPEAMAKANALDPEAGVYMRGALEKVKQLFDDGCVDLDKCDAEITDSYEQVLLRFLKGDVPMMLCNGDTVSGIKKREGKSDVFPTHKFKYAFYPVPTSAEGGYFIDSPSVEFSVNKDCENLDMTNEFMRFLLQTKELDNLAAWKGLISASKTTPIPPIYYPVDESHTPVYTPFSSVPASRIISPEVIGVKDPLVAQIRFASFYVGRGELTIDEAIAKYGSLKDTGPLA